MVDDAFQRRSKQREAQLGQEVRRVQQVRLPGRERLSSAQAGPLYTILYHTVLCYTMLYYAILYYVMLYYTTLYYGIPFDNMILYYTVKHYDIMWHNTTYDYMIV